MKKVLASALAVLMAGAVLAGCGSSDSSASKADATSSAAESKAEESKAEESKAEESKAEESKAEESKAEESKAEESKAEESQADESKASTDIAYDAAATETVIELEDPDTGAWANCFGDGYIDYHTIPRDTDLTITMEVKLSDTFLGMLEAGILNGDEQIGFAPTSMSADGGWKHLGEELGYVTSDMFPVGVELAQMEGASDGTYKLKPKMKDGEVRKNKKGEIMYEEDVYMVEDDSKMAPLYSKPDGFIKWNDQWKEWGSEVQTVTFTVTKDAVNYMLDSIASSIANATPDENGVNPSDFGGLLFQCSGNFEVKKVTINHGNLLLSTQYSEWAEAHPGESWLPAAE